MIFGKPPSSAVRAAPTSETDTGLRGYSAYCTHEGCEVAWDASTQQVLCPCHLSRFNLDGTVAHPPATGSLDTYPLKLSSDGNTITLDPQVKDAWDLPAIRVTV